MRFGSRPPQRWIKGCRILSRNSHPYSWTRALSYHNVCAGDENTFQIPETPEEKFQEITIQVHHGDSDPHLPAETVGNAYGV